MSGICGIVDLSGERPVSEEEMRLMIAPLAHRGPDAEAIRVSESGTCGFGCRRLAANDVEGGDQPMTNEDGRIMLVHDGEIYNAPDLRKVLVSRKHRFSTKGGSEVILHLYEDHAAECVSALRGSFALAVWDEGTRSLWLARDRLGKKPLYVAQTPGRLYFASEPRAIFALDEVVLEVDLEAVDLYLVFQHVPAPRTIWQGVTKLQAGHSLVSYNGRVSVSPYWEPAVLGESVGDMEEWGERVFNELFESVKVRIDAEVPIGVLLSGGIDSSIVAGLMNLARPGQVKTFTMGIEGDGASEVEIARRTARHFAADHHEIVVRPDPWEAAQALAAAHDEPFGDAESIPLWYLARFAREHVKVALTGDGADEAFLGYPRYAAAETTSRVDDAPSAARMAGRIGKRLTDRLLPSSHFKRQATRFLDRLGEGPEERILAFPSTFSREDRVRYYGEALRERMTDPWQVLEPYFKRSPWSKGAGAAAYVDLFTSLPDHQMARLDAVGMAHSLEMRCPFLDHLLVEMALSIPPSVRMENLRTKTLLRFAFANLVPQEVLHREKTGFTLPLATWFRGELGDRARDVLLDATGRARGYFKPSAVETMLADHAAGKTDHGSRLWAMLMLEMWHRKYVGTEPLA